MTVTCSVDGCSNPVERRDYCSLHYVRWRRKGDPGQAGYLINLTGEIQHGEYKGFLAHRRRKEPPCDECRQARNAYIRGLRRSVPRVMARQQRTAKVRFRALVRLAKLHPAEYNALFAEESERLRDEAS